jgi:N-acetylmuramoyl-L-alanine amidase
MKCKVLHSLVALMVLGTLHAHSTDALVGVGMQPGATADEISQTLRDLLNEMESPGSIAFSPSAIEQQVTKAKAAHANATVAVGDASGAYDIVIQAGHYRRKKGATGGEGQYVNEQEMSAWVGEMLSENLRARGYNVLFIDADNYVEGMRPKIFLSLHTDSSALPCKLGPSVGYDTASDAKGMHGIALALALTMGIDPTAFMRDSYTKGLKSYYAFRDFNVSYFEGVLEMSELSCPSQEEALLSRAELLADNLAVGVHFALKSPFE